MSALETAVEAVRAAARRRAAGPAPAQLNVALEAKRELYGLTKTAFAALLGMSGPRYAEVLAGHRELTLRQARTAYKLGIDADALLDSA